MWGTRHWRLRLTHTGRGAADRERIGGRWKLQSPEVEDGRSGVGDDAMTATTSDFRPDRSCRPTRRQRRSRDSQVTECTPGQPAVSDRSVYVK